VATTDVLQPNAPQPTFVGQGDLPPDLDKANWGAFAFAYIWVFLWGPRSWRNGLIGLFVILLVIDNIALLFFDSRTTFPAVARITMDFSLIAWPAAMVFYGARVNRLVWNREGAKHEAEPDGPARPIPLERYRKSTRFWTRLFVGLLILNLAFTAYALTIPPVAWRDFIPPPVTVAVVALFTYDRLHARRRANKRIERSPQG